MPYDLYNLVQKIEGTPQERADYMEEMEKVTNKNGNGKKSEYRVIVVRGVKDGPFAGEKIVYFTIGDKTISARVSEEYILRKKSTPMLRVEVYGNDRDRTLIGIPGECFATTRRH